jgi:hypothetical protein
MSELTVVVLLSSVLLGIFIGVRLVSSVLDGQKDAHRRPASPEDELELVLAVLSVLDASRSKKRRKK